MTTTVFRMGVDCGDICKESIALGDSLNHGRVCAGNRKSWPIVQGQFSTKEWEGEMRL